MFDSLLKATVMCLFNGYSSNFRSTKYLSKTLPIESELTDNVQIQSQSFKNKILPCFTPKI